MNETHVAQPFVSIITPCYRQGRFLPAAIACVRAQTYANIEMVIVNDGSDDNTDAVATRAGAGVVYIKQANAGLAAARNAGIAASSGEYLLFLDADDLLDPQAVEWLVEAMDGRRDRLCVMGIRLFESDPSQGEERYLPVGAPGLPRMFRDNLAPPHAYLCSRAMLDAVGKFEARPRGCEDWDLWLRMMLRGCQLQTVGKIGALYRQYTGSMSTNLLHMTHGRIIVLERALRMIESDAALQRQWGPQLGEIRRDRAQMYFDLGYHNARRGMAVSAIGSYAKAIGGGFNPVASVLAMAKALAHAAVSNVARTPAIGRPAGTNS